jgi:2-dehydro-3-deoxyglucarate aldolase/4-hydroxy-2-oxoheptanedioate aldolase
LHKSSLVERLREPDAFLIGTWSKIHSIEAIELIGHVGFDFVVIDMEHTPHTVRTAYQAIATAQSVGLYAMVRVADHAARELSTLLDGGIDGILVPRVETLEQAQEITGAMAFPPLGNRGMGYGSRASKWGLETVQSYMDAANDHVVRGVQLENLGALEQVEHMFDAQALNAIFIGFGDLALSSGLPRTHETILDLEAKTISAAKRRNIPVGTAVQHAHDVNRCRSVGYSFCTVSADTSIFAEGARATVENARSALAG